MTKTKELIDDLKEILHVSITRVGKVKGLAYLASDYE
ncbi:hypothetical protein SK3146_03197 [Paenibacillus konkukensis]|uniref:Uncharacterized protein n=1 Tax=Paenibacillus konkukensis TaxID=2020716 RepID=A0ABY4RP60_9BACL|nr:hypothetical protein SK3146_03197 [Paenibacillus konkukensis]